MNKKELEQAKKMEENGWYEIEKHVVSKGFQRVENQKFLTDADAFDWIAREPLGGLYSIIRVEITRTVVRTIRK